MFKLFKVIKHEFGFISRIHAEGKLMESPSSPFDALPHLCKTNMRFKHYSRLTIFMSKPSVSSNHHAGINACFAVVLSGSPP